MQYHQRLGHRSAANLKDLQLLGAYKCDLTAYSKWNGKDQLLQSPHKIPAR